ncbi:nitroreductase/quinone reductase family protein [Nocardia stercoris]|uniref:Nitroreductase family deazaflavin-dependent oxidoreductase n=1 Tax=Nocardia stercoris TaxID=2483361 RepID=A0A3M2KT81_9NOCA|nr:nitroreductase/quinone reductase family protein [Nocardia stercoris]RMI28659.1 nitroreductase family deazaflavin-dependent oxidoreductase [Nocardia stercoris]
MTESFPSREWGSRTSPLGRFANWFAATDGGSRAIRALIPLDRSLLERTRGRFTVLGPIGVPIMLLTTTGRKSGVARTSPLLYVHGGDVLYVIGSNFGQAHHPAWTVNLRADPKATVVLAGETLPVEATEITDADHKDEIFRQFAEVTDAYTAYKDRTSRDLRIFALRRS